jgi:hypothetical protein
METDTPVSFRARLQRLIAYQDVFARNSLLAQRTCEQGLLRYFHSYLENHIIFTLLRQWNNSKSELFLNRI